MEGQPETVADALERLAISLCETGAVQVGELVRGLERAAERLRLRTDPSAAPNDLVTQAEASRVIGVSRQAVNQWVRKGSLRLYDSAGPNGRSTPRVSLAEVAIAANRRVPSSFSPVARRELVDFLDGISGAGLADLAESLRAAIDDTASAANHSGRSRVLREFVMAAMSSDDSNREFSPEGVRLLASLSPELTLDLDSAPGRLADSLRLVVRSSDGTAGFDSPAAALLGLLGMATVGTCFSGPDTEVAGSIARIAAEVWGPEWTSRLYDAAVNVGALRPAPLVRYSSSLTYLDNHRFLRQAQTSGVTILHIRRPGLLLPQRFYGAPIHNDILHDRRIPSPVWAFTKQAAQAVGRPAENSSEVNPFRVFNHEYGVLDASIQGIRRYCFSAATSAQELRASLAALPASQRKLYTTTAIQTLARTIAQPYIELVAIDAEADFDWWKDHLIRASQTETLIGLRDEAARRVSHSLLVQTRALPGALEAAGSDTALRERLRIYVKNLEFDVINERYQDDLRRGTARMIKEGGRVLSAEESLEMATAEINSYLG